jgi:acetolactate synthase-1/2/3 large subunit
VWEDHEYGLIAWKQDNQFGRHTDLSFGNPDWALLARSFGWSSHLVAEAAGVRPALEAAFATEGPSLVVVPIDYRENRILTERLGNIQFAI